MPRNKVCGSERRRNVLECLRNKSKFQTVLDQCSFTTDGVWSRSEIELLTFLLNKLCFGIPSPEAVRPFRNSAAETGIIDPMTPPSGILRQVPTKNRDFQLFSLVFLIFVGWELKFQFSRSNSTKFHPERLKFSPYRLQFSFVLTQQTKLI